MPQTAKKHKKAPTMSSASNIGRRGQRRQQIWQCSNRRCDLSSAGASTPAGASSRSGRGLRGVNEVGDSGSISARCERIRGLREHDRVISTRRCLRDVARRGYKHASLRDRRQELAHLVANSSGASSRSRDGVRCRTCGEAARNKPQPAAKANRVFARSNHRALVGGQRRPTSSRARKRSCAPPPTTQQGRTDKHGERY
jgi:hypothetical protein